MNDNFDIEAKANEVLELLNGLTPAQMLGVLGLLQSSIIKATVLKNEHRLIIAANHYQTVRACLHND